MMPVMPRILLLLFVLSAMTMMFIAKCGINMDSRAGDDTDGSGPDTRAVPQSEYFADLMKTREEHHQLELQSLKEKISQLEEALHGVRKLNNGTQSLPQTSEIPYRSRALFYESFFQQKIKESEIKEGIQLHNEYEVIPFCRFTANRIYLVDPGLGKRVVEKPIGFKKKDLNEVIAYSVEKLNSDREPGASQYTNEDFIEGIYRTEPTMGAHYELYFKDIDSNVDTSYRKVTASRPFGPLHLITKEDTSTKKELINIILPLSGRTEKFQHFMERFVRVCVRGDKRVFLTVVYFGTDGLNEVKNILGQVSKLYRFKSMKLVTLNESFSRGRGLQVGAQSWTQGDVLMFLCDVDIVFNTEFLERCRLNAEGGRRVYYPMVFSLYNPNVVYSLHNLEVPSEDDQLVISKDTGFWRDFGFGMTCQYRSDFINLRGFDEQITGWGMEDVLLYRKYVRSDLMVIRATDPGIFHLWHTKQCDPNLTWEQYRGCIRSKALNEASHAQLGMLAFKEEVDAHKNLVSHQKLPVR